MKVAIVTERIDVTLGGAERSVSDLASALASLGLEVHILAAKGRPDTGNTHILCESTPGRRVSLSVFEKALKRHLSQNGYDIVHSVLPFDFADIYQPRGGAYAESIIRNAASYRNKFMGCYKRITAFFNLRRTMLLHAERKVCTQPDGPTIVAISNYVAEQFKRHHGLTAGRIVTIANGVKIPQMLNKDERKSRRAQLLTRSGISRTDNPVLFLFAAHNFRLKGLGSLIRAFCPATAKATARPAVLLVAGKGKAPKYYRLARKLNINDSIVFLGAVKDITGILSISDVAVLPTFYDPSSRFILEALTIGRPVITTGFNGATDLFVNNRHGIVIDGPENIAALTEAIRHFTDPDNIQKASQAIIEDNLKDRICIERVAKDLLSVYKSIRKVRAESNVLEFCDHRCCSIPARLGPVRPAHHKSPRQRPSLDRLRQYWRNQRRPRAWAKMGLFLLCTRRPQRPATNAGRNDLYRKTG